MLAHLWALDYHMAFFDGEESTHPWVLVPYERLLTEKTDELKRIAAASEVDLTEAARRRLWVVSSSASADVKTVEVEKQLMNWRRHLNAEQVERILSIAHAYGLDMYSENPEPDYARLNVLQNQAFTWSN